MITKQMFQFQMKNLSARHLVSQSWSERQVVIFGNGEGWGVSEKEQYLSRCSGFTGQMDWQQELFHTIWGSRDLPASFPPIHIQSYAANLWPHFASFSHVRFTGFQQIFSHREGVFISILLCGPPGLIETTVKSKQNSRKVSKSLRAFLIFIHILTFQLLHTGLAFYDFFGQIRNSGWQKTTRMGKVRKSWGHHILFTDFTSDLQENKYENMAILGGKGDVIHSF